MSRLRGLTSVLGPLPLASPGARPLGRSGAPFQAEVARRLRRGFRELSVGSPSTRGTRRFGGIRQPSLFFAGVRFQDVLVGALQGLGIPASCGAETRAHTRAAVAARFSTKITFNHFEYFYFCVVGGCCIGCRADETDANIHATIYLCEPGPAAGAAHAPRDNPERSGAGANIADFNDMS